MRWNLAGFNGSVRRPLTHGHRETYYTNARGSLVPVQGIPLRILRVQQSSVGAFSFHPLNSMLHKLRGATQVQLYLDARPV